MWLIGIFTYVVRFCTATSTSTCPNHADKAGNHFLSSFDYLPSYNPKTRYRVPLYLTGLLGCLWISFTVFVTQLNATETSTKSQWEKKREKGIKYPSTGNIFRALFFRARFCQEVWCGQHVEMLKMNLKPCAAPPEMWQCVGWRGGALHTWWRGCPMVDQSPRVWNWYSRNEA